MALPIATRLFTFFSRELDDSMAVKYDLTSLLSATTRAAKSL